MKHIYQDDSGTVDFSEYFDYLRNIKNQMPPKLYQFAVDESRYSLSDPLTMHDSWLESLVIKEILSETNDQLRLIQLILKLLGPFHDRYFKIVYKNVRNYHLETISEYQFPPYHGHGDLLYHEFCVTDDKYLSHELKFSSGTTFYFECADIVIEEMLIEKT